MKKRSMESVVATVSGYHGSERFNIIKLISHAGASYVGSLSQSTTHLVCWRFEGRKYELAKKLKTIIVNHRWIEDCIKEGKRLSEDPYMLQSGEEMGPLLLEIPDVAKRDALTKKCKVFSDKSNVHDEVGNKTSDVGYGGSGLSDWSKSALLDENLFPGLGKISSHKLKSKPFRKSWKDENWLSSTNRFQETSSTGLARKEVEKHGESSSYASMPPMRNKRKISKNKESNAHCSAQLLREERNIPNGNRDISLIESSQRKGRRLVKNVNRDIVVSNISDSDQDCYPPRVHKKYSQSINPSDSLNRRTVSLSEIGGPSNNDFSKHRGEDEEIEEVEEMKLCNHQPPSKDLTSLGKDAPSESERTSPNGCSDAERESQYVDQIELASSLSTSMELSCVICWTEFSPTRGVLPCGHRFCYSCIQDWADHMTSRRKTPFCPLCKASFMSITKVEDAAICDQKIFSQTIPCATSTLDVSILFDQERPGFGAQFSSASVCIKCRSREPEDLLVSCHFCQIRNIHRYCLDPPLFPWTCIHCKDIERLNLYNF